MIFPPHSHTHIDNINSTIFMYQDANGKQKQAGPGDLRYQSHETWRKKVRSILYVQYTLTKPTNLPTHQSHWYQSTRQNAMKRITANSIENTYFQGQSKMFRFLLIRVSFSSPRHLHSDIFKALTQKRPQYSISVNITHSNSLASMSQVNPLFHFPGMLPIIESSPAAPQLSSGISSTVVLYDVRFFLFMGVLGVVGFTWSYLVLNNRLPWASACDSISTFLFNSLVSLLVAVMLAA